MNSTLDPCSWEDKAEFSSVEVTLDGVQLSNSTLVVVKPNCKCKELHESAAAASHDQQCPTWLFPDPSSNGTCRCGDNILFYVKMYILHTFFPTLAKLKQPSMFIQDVWSGVSLHRCCLQWLFTQNAFEMPCPFIKCLYKLERVLSYQLIISNFCHLEASYAQQAEPNQV